MLHGAAFKAKHVPQCSPLAHNRQLNDDQPRHNGLSLQKLWKLQLEYLHVECLILTQTKVEKKKKNF